MTILYFIQLTTPNTLSTLFNIYSNVSGTPLLSNVTKTQLQLGVFVNVPYNANLITVKSVQGCDNLFNISVTPGTTTTTTTSTTTQAPLDCQITASVIEITTTTTTAPPTTTTTSTSTTTTTTSTTTECPEPECQGTTTTTTTTTSTTTEAPTCNFTFDVDVTPAPYVYNVCTSYAGKMVTPSCADACGCTTTATVYTNVPLALNTKVYQDSGGVNPFAVPYISYGGNCYQLDWDETFSYIYVISVTSCIT